MRPQPVRTSSVMNKTSEASQIRFISLSTQAGYIGIPPAPGPKGATMKAAGAALAEAA